MRRIREVLRLYFDFQWSVRAIAHSAHVSRTAVREVLDRVQKTGLTRDALLPMDDGEIEAALYGQTPATEATRGFWNGESDALSSSLVECAGRLPHEKQPWPGNRSG